MPARAHAHTHTHRIRPVTPAVGHCPGTVEALADVADAEASDSSESQLALTNGEIPAGHVPKKSLAEIAKQNKSKAEEKAQKAEALKAKQHSTYFSDLLQLYKAIPPGCFAIPGFHIDCVYYD